MSDMLERLKFNLRVFIASPSDVADERDIAEEEIEALNQDNARDKIVLEPYLWERQARPTLQTPQDTITPELEKSELIVGILWSKLGSPARLGSSETAFMEELRIAIAQVKAGQSGDVFLYFKKAPPASPGHWEEVQQFKKAVDSGKECFFWEFHDKEDFRGSFRRHLRNWYRDWEPLVELCQYGLQRIPPQLPKGASGNEKLARVQENFAYADYPALTSFLGQRAVDHYQAHFRQGRFDEDLWFTAAELDGAMPGWSRCPVVAGATLADLRPLTRLNDDTIGFSNGDWFCFFCAYGLVEAIAANRLDAVTQQAYVNPVHQYLSALGARRKPQIVPSLLAWLTNAHGDTEQRPVARNFAAFVLGMLDAREAQAELEQAVRSDPDPAVRYYAIHSLIKLRSRKSLPLFTQLFKNEPTGPIRDLVAVGACHVLRLCDVQL